MGYYAHPDFRGSSSIKNVLPVLVPGLQYDPTGVHDGSGAIEAWLEVIEPDDEMRRAELRQSLLAYCELNTLAMVEIYRVVVGQVLAAE